jgi:hypothetical protein
MVDMIYFLICLAGACFFSAVLGWQVGYKDAKKDCMKRNKNPIEI